MAVAIKKYLIITEDYEMYTTDDETLATHAAEFAQVVDTTTGLPVPIEEINGWSQDQIDRISLQEAPTDWLEE